MILSKFTIVSSFKEWFVLEVVAGQSFPVGNVPDNHSLGQTHSIQVALFLVPEEWPSYMNGLG